MSIPRLQSEKIRNTLPKAIEITKIVPILTLFLGGLLLAQINGALAHESQEGVLGLNTTFLSTLQEGHAFQGVSLPPKSVRVRTVEGEELLLTYAPNVEALLNELAHEIDENDKVKPALDHLVVDGLLVTLTKVDSEFQFKQEDFPYQTEIVETTDLEPGVTELKQKGVNGVLTHTYLLTYQDGRLIDNKLLDSVVTVAPVTEIILKGEREKPIFDCNKWDHAIDQQTQDPTKRHWLKEVMRCESACSANIISKSGAFHGLFQFKKSTFYSWEGEDIYDGNEQIDLVIRMLEYDMDRYAPKDKQAGAWPVCNAKAWASMPDF